MKAVVRTIYGFIYTLRPYERGIQETLGKYSGFKIPGLGFQIPLVENSLHDNAKVVITEHGISPTLLLGSLPVNIAAGTGNGKGVRLVKDEYQKEAMTSISANWTNCTWAETGTNMLPQTKVIERTPRSALLVWSACARRLIASAVRKVLLFVSLLLRRSSCAVLPRFS